MWALGLRGDEGQQPERGRGLEVAVDGRSVLGDVRPVASDLEDATDGRAAGIRARLRADFALATTGVAGPTDQDGHSPGTVHVALVGPGEVLVRSFTGDERLRGDRAAVREQTARVALDMLLSHDHGR
jgi:CO/xanthine dehydrogenase FAD-binding subunit